MRSYSAGYSQGHVTDSSWETISGLGLVIHGCWCQLISIPEDGCPTEMTMGDTVMMGKWVESGTGHPFLVHQNGSSKSVPMEMCVAIIGISPRSVMWHEIKMPKPAVSTVNQIDMQYAAAKRQTYSFNSKLSLDGIFYIKGRIMSDR